MARPKKWRKVCCLPEINRFGPLWSRVVKGGQGDGGVDKSLFI